MLTTALLLAGLTLFLQPDLLLRRIVQAVTRLLYRLTVTGRRHVPAEGGALLVANHVSWVDGLLLMAIQRRRIRFVMDRKIYSTPLLRPLFRRMGMIPVSAGDGRQGLKEFIRGSRRALDDGDLVCIFAEGEITRNGMLNAFKGGFERIVKGSDHPIIPVYIGGAWGSIFSYAHGKLLSRLPVRLPYPVAVAFGTPLPAGSNVQAVRQAVMELSCDWFNARKPGRRSLGELFVGTARRNWRRPAIADTGGRRLNYGRTLTAATALAGKLAVETGGARMVGVCLPPTAGGEMVPHSAVEDALHAALDRTGVLAVPSVPDDNRGEKLVVVHTPEAGEGAALHRLLSRSGLPNLWKPARDCFVAVERLPLLGTGKPDLRKIREMTGALLKTRNCEA
jgi:acyl-[acyl-carrier-protein]-phospholipid O-acyltransferase/long-chain-fatty-acid--[acyl-carrier-protein] ligase